MINLNEIKIRGGKKQANSVLPPFILLLFFYSSLSYGDNGRIDLNFQHLPLSEALTIYADYTGTNMIIDTSIDELVDLRLHQVQPSSVLGVLVKMYDLVKFYENGITTIMKREVFESRNQSRQVEVISIKHLPVDGLLKSLSSKNIRSGKSGKSKNFNSISLNKLTNSLIIQGTYSFIERNKKIISRLDIEQKQLTISAKLVSISDVELKNLGLKLKTAVTVGDQIMDGLVDLGVSATSSFSFLLTKVGKFALDIELDALQKNGIIKVISNPTLFTLNNKRARISQGVQIPYQVQDRDGSFHNEFKDALLSLSVLPRIVDDEIFLDIAITKDSPSDVTASEILIDTRSINSSVRMQSGETIILGGIKDSETSHNVSKVPFLSDIPFIGSWLFTSYSDASTHRNLVVFITPKIL